MIPRLRLLLLSGILLASCSPSTPPADDGFTDGAADVFEIPTGGEIEFPAGSLAGSVNLMIESADSVPLPAGVSAAGTVVSLELDGRADRPAILRLPAPAGAQTNEVFVFQVESDGTTTLLSTEVTGGILAAATDYFTIPAEEAARQVISLDAIKAAIGLREAQTDVPDLSPPRQGRIVGPSFLRSGEAAVFMLSGFESEGEDALQLEWSLYGPGLLQVPAPSEEVEPAVRLLESRTAIVEATEAGRIDLTASYADPRSGTRGFAARVVSVQEAEVGELVLFFLRGETERIAGVDAEGFGVGVLNRTSGPVTFEWDYGDGGPEATGSTGAQNSLTVITPDYRFDARGAYTAEIRATHADGATGTLEVPVTVRATELGVVIEGPGVATTASSPFATTAYEIVLSNDLPFNQVAWELFPGSQRDVVRTLSGRVTAMVFFSEPGSYVLAAKAADGLEEAVTEEDLASVEYTASFARPVTVTGARELTLSFTGNVMTAAPEQVLEFSYDVRGGQLIVNGRQLDYRLDISWGDGETAVLTLPADGTTVGVQDVLAHTFVAPAEYTVEATAVDPLGNRVSKQWTVTVEEDAMEPTEPEPDIEPFNIVSIAPSTITPLVGCDPPDLVDVTLELEGPVDYPAVASFEATVCDAGAGVPPPPCLERLATVDSLDGKSFTLSGPTDLVLEDAFECFDLVPEFVNTRVSLRFRCTVTDSEGRQDEALFLVFCCERGASSCPDACP